MTTHRTASSLMNNAGGCEPSLSRSVSEGRELSLLLQCVCGGVWCFALVYSIYRACHSAQELYTSLTVDDFESGWDGRARDISDYEWAVFSQIILHYAPWFAAHILLTNLLKHYHSNFLLHFFITSSLLFLVNVVGLFPTFLLIFQILLHYFVQQLKSKWLCWTCSGLFILFLNYEAGLLVKGVMDLSDSREEYILSVTISWTTCRCLSFCLLQCSQSEAKAADQRNSLLHMLAYTLYLPLLLTGPIVAFDDFRRDLEVRPTAKCYAASFLNIFRYSFWFGFNMLLRHYVYLSALNYHPHLVDGLPVWSLCGFALGMSQLFMLKYVVLFGLPSSVAQAEGFRAPSKPKCIARIHLYSDMWKYFDEGLYMFLKRFVYVPVVSGGRGKLSGGFLCFAFIYVWHGASRSVFVWTLLNFVGVTVENVAARLAQTASYQRIISRLPEFVAVNVGGGSMALLLVMSAASNFYFICGYEVGNIIVKKIILAGLSGPIFPIWLVLICMCHSSEAIKSWEKKRNTDNKSSIHVR